MRQALFDHLFNPSSKRKLNVVFERRTFVCHICEAYLLSFIASAQREEQLKNYNVVRLAYRTLFWRSMLSLIEQANENVCIFSLHF